ncbi:carbonic anhydrase [bacterium]|nr:carbonic anhydrase [bacterium]
MKKSFQKILQGYHSFRENYAHGDKSLMQYLSHHGQKPQTMVVSCCDSRVDPALILQCDPGDLFVVRNIANIVPPYEKDGTHHGTSAALEFGVRFLNVKHLILLGHSQCSGIKALLKSCTLEQNDFITNWVSVIKLENPNLKTVDDYEKLALQQSYDNCMNFPWIKEKVLAKKLTIHLWFFDIKTAQIFSYSHDQQKYSPLDSCPEYAQNFSV